MFTVVKVEAHTAGNSLRMHCPVVQGSEQLSSFYRLTHLLNQAGNTGMVVILVRDVSHGEESATLNVLPISSDHVLAGIEFTFDRASGATIVGNDLDSRYALKMFLLGCEGVIPLRYITEIDHRTIIIAKC